tara:strand:+ start:12042 stop:12533 length:492 start_codon:yes stop_codon:yes gene_type:complete
MAISKLRDDKGNNKYDDVIDDNSDEPFMVLIKHIFEKIDEGVTKTNEHITKMATNDAKVGITQSQADAIVSNTAKTGITTQQATDITTNNAKVGITTKQSQQLSLLVQSAIQLSSVVKGTTVSTPALTLIPGKVSGSYSIRLSVRVTPQGGKTVVKYVDLPLT